MMLRWRNSHGGYRGNLILALILLLIGNCFFAGGQASALEVSGYELVELKNISVDQCKQYLAQITKTTVTKYPRLSTVLLSSEQPQELAKAKVILDLIDSPEKYVIKDILPISGARNIPSNDQIAAKLHPSLTRGVSIGSFSNPPRKGVSSRVLIDIHNNAVIAIAPVKLLERIESAINPLAGLDENNKPQAQEGPHTPAEQQVSSLIAPNEAKFIFAASSADKAPPKGSQEKTQPDNSGAKPKPKPVTTRTVPETATARPQANVNAAKTLPNRSATQIEEAATTPAESAEPDILESIPNPDEIVNLALADFEKLTIVQFLGLVGPYLQLDFLYDPKILTGEFAINPNGKWRGPIKIRDLYPMLEDVLKFNKLAMTRSGGNLVTIVPVAEAIEIDPPLIGIGLDVADRGDGIVTRVFDLEHIDTASATNLLNSMRLTIVPPIPKGKALIITGYAHRMPRIEALLKIIDEPGEVKKFRFRQLIYTMAETLAPKLQILAEQLGTVSITVTETPDATSTPTTTVRKPGESAAQYETRRRAEAAARARAIAAARARSTPTTGLPEPEESTVYLDSDKRTNRILMIGLPDQLDEVEELIDTLDVVQQDLRTLELYRLEHVDAEEVRNKLEELGIIRPRLRTTSPYSSRITGAKPATTTTGTTTTPRPSTTTSMTQLYDETEEPPGEEPQIVVVEQTNSLLVNATSEQHEKIKLILSYIDNEMLDKDIPVQLYLLENQSPEHLAGVLEKLIEETVLDKEGKIVDKINKQDEQIIIVPEPNTFSLIVYASKKNQDWISNIIKNLDKRRPQVLIDVTLVQISKTDAFDYDLNILSSLPDLTETAGVTGALMGGAEGTNLVSSLLNARRDRYIDFKSQGGNGTGFYGDRHINALLTAMHQKDYGRVLAKPKILVNDNEEGLIKTMDTTFVTRTGSTVVEGVQGTVQTSQEFQDFEAGIELKITPHISSGDLLRLDIILSRSDFGTITGEKPPDIQSSDIDTTVTVPDGSTIILGGLIKLNQSKGGTKVPLLGDLPFIGGLFRSASNSDIQRNLYVFVKAEIIRPPDSGLAQDDLMRISDRNRTAFEEHEAEFQQYHDWPGIKPEPMKPLKVLEAQ